MGEFDQGRNLWRGGDDFAIAERPMIAAASAGAGGAHDRTPENDGDVPAHNEPGVSAKPKPDAGGRGCRKRFCEPGRGSGLAGDDVLHRENDCLFSVKPGGEITCLRIVSPSITFLR